MKKYFKDSKEIDADEYYARLLSGESDLYKEVDTEVSSKGAKFDSGKQPWFAMPLEVLKPLADVFAAGEKKYATFNCLQPFDNSDRRFYNAQMRHTEQCQLDPLAVDDETGCYHAAQVAFSTLMRLHHAKKERGL